MIIPVSIKQGGQLTGDPFIFACMLFICAGIVALCSLVWYLYKNKTHVIVSRSILWSFICGIAIFVSVWNFGRLLERYRYGLINVLYTVIIIIGSFLIGIGLYKETVTPFKLFGLMVLLIGLWIFYSSYMNEQK